MYYSIFRGFGLFLLYLYSLSSQYSTIVCVSSCVSIDCCSICLFLRSDSLALSYSSSCHPMTLLCLSKDFCRSCCYRLNTSFSGLVDVGDFFEYTKLLCYTIFKMMEFFWCSNVRASFLLADHMVDLIIRYAV